MLKDLILNPDVLQGQFVTTSGEQSYTYGKGDKKITDHGYIEGLTFEPGESYSDFKGNRKGLATRVKHVLKERNASWKFTSASTGNLAVKASFYGGVAREGVGNNVAFATDTAVAVGDMVTVGDTLLRVTTAGTTDAQAPDLTNTKKGDVVQSGSASLVSMGKTEDNIIRSFTGGNAIRDVSKIFVLSTEDSDGLGGSTVIIVIPNAQEQGTGSPKVEDFDGFEFTVSVAPNEDFQPLPEYGAFAEGENPDSIVLVVPNSRVEEVVNAYAAKLMAYRDAL